MNKRQAKKKHKFLCECKRFEWFRASTWSEIRWQKQWLIENRNMDYEYLYHTNKPISYAEVFADGTVTNLL